MGRSFRPATIGDLREYIAILDQLGEERFRRGGRGYKGHALHRPDRNPSLGVFIGREGGIVVTDHSQGKSWSAYNYLKELGREDLARRWLERFEEWDPTREKSNHAREKRKAKSELPLPEPKVTYAEVLPTTDEWEATAKARMEEAREALLNGEHPKTLYYMERRGLTPEDAYELGFGATEEGIAIPVYDEDIQQKSVKIRRHDESKGERFFHLFKKRGNGYYFSPGFTWKPMLRVIIVEGELNAGAVHKATSLPTIGLPGAGTGLSLKLVQKLKRFVVEVVLVTDQDDAGRRLVEHIMNQLVADGYDIGRIYIPMEDRYHRDAMDILKDKGWDYLTEQLKERIFNRAAKLHGCHGVGTGLAKIAQESQDGLNTKRALAQAIGIEVARRHASYVPPEEKEAMKNLEDYLTKKATQRGAEPAHARKTVRRWMDERNITPRTALFIVYEYNGVPTGTREANRKFGFQRQRHPFTSQYRAFGEKGRVLGFDIDRLLEDAVKEILEMVEKAILHFKKLKEKIDEERRRFAEWMKGFPHLLGYIVRSKVAVVGAPITRQPVPMATSPPMAMAC